MWGVQLLRAIFGKSGLMDQLAEQRPALCQWELIVADRMSLTTNQRYDTEPTREDRHAYLTKDQDGPERNYNAELVRAAIQFDTNLMLQQTAETQFSKQQSDHNAAVEGVSYSVKDLSNELQIGKMKLLMSADRQTKETPTTREQVSSDIISELPTLDEDKETLVLRKRHFKEEAKQQDCKFKNNKVWESGDSPLPCLAIEDKAITAVADAYVKLRQGNEPVGAISCPANTTIKIGTYNPQGCGGLVADEKNNSRFDEFMHTEKPDVFTMPEPQVPAGRARRLGHTSRYHTMINKYASNNKYTVFTTHHHSGRATHGVLMMVKEDIQVIKVERGLDEGHDEQWEGRVLAVYTEGICFLGLYMPHATAARDLLRDQIKAFIKRCDKKVILMTDINALATEDKSITVVHPKGTYTLVEQFKPDYFTAEHEGQHVMFTKQRVRETNELLEECGMSVLNDATENTTHFNAGFALHEGDKVLVKRLQEGDRTTMSLYDRQRAMYCQGLRAKATIDVLALGKSASQSMTAHNVRNSMKDSDRTTKECHSACYQSDHSALTVEITLNESNMIRRSGITGSICSIIGNPNNYRAALLTHLQTDTRGTRRKHFHSWAQNANHNNNGQRWRGTIHKLIKQCVQANTIRMMMGLSGNLATRSLEQCHPERLQLEMIPTQRMERIIEMAGVGETWSRQDQTHYNKHIHGHSIQHRLYTHAHNIRKRMYSCKHFKKVPFTRKRNATGIFQEAEMKLTFENYIHRLKAWVEDRDRDKAQRSLLTLWRTNSNSNLEADNDKVIQHTSSTPDVFDCWELSTLEKVAIRVSIKTCQLAAKKSARYRLNWSSIPMAATHWLKNGPVALIWSVRMALLEPKHLARIGKQHPKTLQNKETALLKEKLNTVRKCSMISIPITQRHDLTCKRKTCTEKVDLCIETYKQRKHLKELRNVVDSDKGQPDIPHYIANNSDKRNAMGRINAIQLTEGQSQHNNLPETHPSWTYKEIGPGTAGQAEDEHQLYKIPASICNIQQSRRLMEHAEKGTLKPELYARCRTPHDGITYLSGTTTFGTKQRYCKNMLFDTGCDFNITSAWY